MKLAPLNLSRLEQLYNSTCEQATPHRNPDFEYIHELIGNSDPPVKGTMWFIETHNTGYDGVLERWSFSFTSANGEVHSFWADLLPGYITHTSDPDSPVNPIVPRGLSEAQG